jgi:hypothetical protein
MMITQLEHLAILRAAIGYLGERDQYNWWSSAFFSSQSRAFLVPVFGRTPLLAQCSGVTGAAGLIHDDRIGVGRVFHLFRLPEDIEQGIHHALCQPEVGPRIATIVTETGAAMAYLRDVARMTGSAGIGPTRVGDTKSLREMRAWRNVAALYAHAFTAGGEVFPFFTDQ